MPFELIDTGKGSAEENMRLDEQLLRALDHRPCCQLHLYEWKNPSATYGHFNRSHQWLSKSACQKYGLELAKRPTGGGLIFHQFDFAFSVLLSASHPLFSSNTLECYRLVNERVAKAIFSLLQIDPEIMTVQECPSPTSFCMAKPTIYDLVIGKRKIVGAAQRRTRFGLLHQGSIALQLPPQQFLEEILPNQTALVEAIREHTYPLFENAPDGLELATVKSQLTKKLIELFQWMPTR